MDLQPQSDEESDEEPEAEGSEGLEGTVGSVGTDSPANRPASLWIGAGAPTG